MGVSISIGGGYRPHTKIGKIIAGIISGVFAIGFLIGAIVCITDASRTDSHLEVSEEFEVDGELVGYNQYTVSVFGELENVSNKTIVIDAIRVILSSDFDAEYDGYLQVDLGADTITLAPGEVFAVQEVDLNAGDTYYTDLEDIEYRIFGESDYREVSFGGIDIGGLITGVFLGIGGFIALISAILTLVSAFKKKPGTVSNNGWTGGSAGTTTTYNGNVITGANQAATTRQATHVVCSYCGTKNDKSAAKCNGCGARL